MRKGKTLEQFAKRIETRIRQSGQTDSMERLICRLLTGDDVKVSAILAAKWVEWRYGKATEHLKIEAHVEHEHFDASKLNDDQLEQARQLIESAYNGGDSR